MPIRDILRDAARFVRVAQFQAVIALAISVPAGAQYRAEIGGWAVFNFVANERGRDIVGCMASRNYQDGTRLSFVVTTGYTWGIGAANERWQLRRDATTDVAAYVDRRFVASGKAWHLDDKSAILPLDGDQPFRALQLGHRLDLQTPHGNLAFMLAGSANAMDALLQCVRTLVPPPVAPVPPVRPMAPHTVPQYPSGR